MKKFRKSLATLMALGMLIAGNPVYALAETVPTEEPPAETEMPMDETEALNDSEEPLSEEDPADETQEEKELSSDEDTTAENEEESPSDSDITDNDDSQAAEEAPSQDIVTEETVTDEAVSPETPEEEITPEGKEIPEEEEISEEPEEVTTITAEGAVVSADTSAFPESDTMLQDYIDVLSGLKTPAPISNNKKLLKSTSIGRNSLTGNDLTAYGIISDYVDGVVAGQNTSTSFTIPVSTFLGDKFKYTAAELGVDSIISGESISDEASAALQAKYNIEIQKVLDALKLDNTYKYYWMYRGAYSNVLSYPTMHATYNPSNPAQDTIYVDQDAVITINLHIDPNYRNSEADPVTINPAKVSAAQAAAAKAQEVVNAAASMSDYDKLLYYNDWICKNVTYNYEAAKSGSAVMGVDPWELIYVFDNDPDTNVVCEGYSKAFKYLADLTTFENDSIEVYTVTGTMGGGTGAGPHMWNVVKMEDDNTYMVDVTNNDIDYDDDKEDIHVHNAAHPLFLSGYEKSSAAEGGYVVKRDPVSIGNITFFNDELTYTYDQDTINSYSETIRAIAEEDYVVRHIHNNITFMPWTSTDALPTESGNYYLENDVVLTSTAVVSNTLNLCLNGHNVTANHDNSVIKVTDNGQLGIYDCSAESGSITHGMNGSSQYTGYGINISGTGAVNLFGGSISNNNAGNSWGAGVHMDNGTFNMYGGSVSNNTSPNSSGGVYVDKGTFTLYGGTIASNTSKNNGAGIHLDGGATVVIKGGEITDNSVSSTNYCGGGIYNNGGTLKISGNPVIRNNTHGNNLQDNICLGSSSFITIDDVLNNENKIGVSIYNGGTGTITTGYQTYHPGANPSAYFTCDQEDHSIILRNNEAKIVEGIVHIHDFAYTSSGNTITATCSNDGCDLQDNRIVLTIKAPEKTVYGDGKSASAILSNIADFNEATGLNITPTEIKYYLDSSEIDSAPEDAGEYTARITVEGQTAEVAYAINKATINPKVSLSGWTYGDNANTPQVTGNSGNGDVTYTYSTVVDGEYSSTKPTNAGTYFVKATVAETTNYTGAETAPKEFTIAKKAVIVSGITAENKEYDQTTTAKLDSGKAAFSGKQDGDTLTVTADGVFDNADVGTGKTVTISNLQLGGTSADNYVLAAAGQQASAKADITAITVGLEWSDTDLTYNGTEQKPTAAATGVLEGDECAVTVSGGQTNAGENYTATAESLSNENYVLPDNKTTLFRIAKAGQDAPSAPKMSERTNHSITLTKLDNTQYRMGNGEWQDSNVFDNLNANTEYYFYQRTIGDRNHEPSESSTGAVFKTDAHVHEYRFTVNGPTIAAVCADSDHGHSGDPTQYVTVIQPEKTVFGDDGHGEATILGTIQGTTTSAITYRKGDEVLDSAPTDAGTYTASITVTYGTESATATVKYTIAKASISPSVVLDGWTYGEPAKEPQVRENPGEGTVTYTYSTAADGEYSSTKPTNAGTYFVKAAVAETTNYNGANTAPVSFTIAKKAVTVSGITASNKEYDKTTVAILITGDASFGGKLDNDSLTITATGEFSDANVGTEKTVRISNLKLGGTSAGNYILAESGQQTSASANITPRTVGLKWSDTSFTYDGTAHVPTASATNLLNGDVCTVTVTGEKTDAGKDYTATAESLSNANYALPDKNTTTFVINKADQDAPEAPIKQTASATSITLQSTPGYEYSMNGTDWQTSNVFSGLTKTTSYEFYQRKAEDKNHNASPSSPAADISTTNHTHEWENFTVEGNTITATCRNTDGAHGEPLTATLTLSIPETSVYNGKQVTALLINNIEGTSPSEISYYKLGEAAPLPEAPKYAGIYLASVTLEGKTANAGFAILPKNTDLTWSNTSLTYNGQIQAPTAVATGVVQGDECIVSVSGEQKDAGDNYTATASIDNTNYVLSEETTTQTFKINPKPVTVSGVTVSEKVYDGTAAATVVTEQAVINGKVEGDDLTVSVESGSYENANAGTGKTVNAAFSLGGTSAGNYTLESDTQKLTGNIAQREVTLTWNEPNPPFVYDGQKHAPTAEAGNLVNSDECTVTVDGAAVDAGTHTATAAGLSNPNYKLPAETTHEFTIGKASLNADMFTVTMPAATEYDGNPKNASAAVKDPFAKQGVGTPTLVYFENGSQLTEAPSEAGTYQVKLNVAEGTNYLGATGLENSGWKFEITRATPVLPNEPSDAVLAQTGNEIPLLGSAVQTTGGTVEYSLDGTTWSETIPTGKDVGTYTVHYRVNGGKNYNDVAEKSVTITIKATQPAPAADEFTATKATDDTSKDAEISGVDDTMEYSTDNGKTYQPVSGDKITGLGKGDVLIRHKETETQLPSEPVKVTVQAKEPQNAPTGLSATEASSDTAEDAVISGVNDQMEYSLDGTTFIPVPENATTISGLGKGTVSVRYRETEDKAPSPVTAVVIHAKGDKVYAPTPGSDEQIWTKGSNADLSISIKSDYNDEQTYDLFTGISLDGVNIARDAAIYSVTRGSAVITLKPSYLETLSLGKHTMTVKFQDGEAAAAFYVVEKKVTPDKPVPEKKEDRSEQKKDAKTEQKTEQKTDYVVTCQMAGYPANYAWNESAKACQAGYLDGNGVFHPANTARRSYVPGTGDRGLFGNLSVLLISAIVAIAAGYTLKNH